LYEFVPESLPVLSIDTATVADALSIQPVFHFPSPLSNSSDRITVCAVKPETTNNVNKTINCSFFSMVPSPICVKNVGNYKLDSKKLPIAYESIPKTNQPGVISNITLLLNVLIKILRT